MTAVERERLVEACRFVGEAVGKLIAKQFEPPEKTPHEPVLQSRVAGSPRTSQAEKQDGLLTIGQVADHLGISTRTIFAYVQEGRINVTRIGRAVRVRREELERIAVEGC